MCAPLLLLLQRQGSVGTSSLLPPGLWHAHEMLFGYALAVIAGYLLTHCPTKRLLLLLASWLLARFVWFFDDWLPPPLILACVALFPLQLSLFSSRKFKAAKRLRNRFISLVLWGFGLMALGFYMLLYQQHFSLAYQLVHTSLLLVVLLIIIMGGRLIPPATIGALRQAGREVRIPFQAHLETACIIVMLALMLSNWIEVPRTLRAALPLLLAALLLARLMQWHGTNTLKDPNLWPLHLGYLWLAIGFTLIAASSIEPHLPLQDALHAIALGGIGTVTLTMLVRVSQIRAAQALMRTPLLLLMQALMFCAVCARVVVHLGTRYAEALLWISASLWAAAFALFLIAFYLRRPTIET